jgi:hypothetical protein
MKLNEHKLDKRDQAREVRLGVSKIAIFHLKFGNSLIEARRLFLP